MTAMFGDVLVTVNSFPCVGENVGERGLEGDCWTPARVAHDASVVAAHYRSVDRPAQFVVHNEFDRVLREACEGVGEVLDGAIDSATQVVCRSRSAASSNAAVTGNDVANIGEVPTGLERANLDGRASIPFG